MFGIPATIILVAMQFFIIGTQICSVLYLPLIPRLVALEFVRENYFQRVVTAWADSPNLERHGNLCDLKQAELKQDGWESCTNHPRSKSHLCHASEKACIIMGPEFGKLEDHTLIAVKTFCGFVQLFQKLA